MAVSAGLAALWAFVALPGAAEPDEAANEQPATPPAKALKVKYTEQITDITFVDPRTVQVQVRIVNEGKNVTEVRCAPSVSSADGSYRGSTWDTFGGWLDPGETMEFTALIPVKDEGAAWITTGKPNCTGEGKAIEGFYGAPVVRALEERGFTCDGRQGSAAFAYTCTKPGSGFEQTVTTRDFDDDDRDEIFGTVTPKTAKVLEALGLKKVQIASDGTRITMDDSEGRIPG